MPPKRFLLEFIELETWLMKKSTLIYSYEYFWVSFISKALHADLEKSFKCHDSYSSLLVVPFEVIINYLSSTTKKLSVFRET